MNMTFFGCSPPSNKIKHPEEEDPWRLSPALRDQKSKSDDDANSVPFNKEDLDEEDPWQLHSTRRDQKSKQEHGPDLFDASASSDMKFALRQQKAFDREDRLLREQHEKLKHSAPVVFSCGICKEDISNHMLARPDPCHHEFCRDCIRGYIQSKIEEHRFPIICPLCALDRSTPNPSSEFVPIYLNLSNPKPVPSALNSLFVEQIGLSEREAELFMELELAGFSTLIHCRGWVYHPFCQIFR